MSEIHKLQGKADYPEIMKAIIKRTRDCLDHINYMTLDSEGTQKEVVHIAIYSPQGVVNII